MTEDGYDSTWESDGEEEKAEGAGGGGGGGGGEAAAGAAPQNGAGETEQPGLSRSPPGLQVIGSRNWRAARDMQRYRHEYPDYKDEGESDMVNLRFYKNEIPFQPNGLHINEILKNWKNDYDILEDNHSYIQWLFPLREQGVNWYAKPLTAREIQEFKSSDEVMKRFVQAYELMLGFYGIELVDPELGVVKRANNYPKRFQNLNWHSHNNLRITRILKCLGEMGYEHYQAPLVKFFLEETLVKHRLQNVKQSALDYFVFTVKNKHLRRELVYYAWKNFKPPNKFVWGPLQKLQKFQPQLSIFQSSVDGEGSVDSQNEGPVENQAKTCRMKEIESSGVGLQKDSKERSSLLAASKGSSQRDHQEEELDAPHPEKEKDESGEAQGREGKRLEPENLKESKKRKYEVNKMEDDPGANQCQGSSDIEKIALNLKECALEQSSSEHPSRPRKTISDENEMPSTETLEYDMIDEVRKKRKVDQEGLEKVPVATVVESGDCKVGCLPSSPESTVRDVKKAEEDGDKHKDTEITEEAEVKPKAVTADTIAPMNLSSSSSRIIRPDLQSGSRDGPAEEVETTGISLGAEDKASGSGVEEHLDRESPPSEAFSKGEKDGAGNGAAVEVKALGQMKPLLDEAKRPENPDREAMQSGEPLGNEAESKLSNCSKIIEKGYHDLDFKEGGSTEL
ncbi:opioid growth factor receptor [Ornithorhynchus anatinus]|uniref:opioid growth factor receptor n=1 Tax=Ornithorhynchus anatinus TaxID=9258 RepID=UPI0010A75976|nr:opioid growth factor receptor [Ornithorhynchus anatinus]